MGLLWSLALPLLFCWELGASESPDGPRTSPLGPLVPTNDTEILEVTPGVGASSVEDFQTHNLMETTSAGHSPLQVPTLSTPISVRTPIPASTTLESEAREAEDLSPHKSKTLTKISPSRLSGTSILPMETEAAPSSPLGTILGSSHPEVAIHVLCTEDSSEEVQMALAPASAEGWLPSAPDGPPDLTAPARAQLAPTITHKVMTHCDIIEIEAEAPRKPPPSDTSLSEGREAWSGSETSTFPESPKAKSQTPGTHTSPENSSTVTATTSSTVAGLLPAEGTRAREDTAAQAPTLDGNLGTLSMRSLEETTGSEDSLSLTKLSGSVDFPPGARTAVTKATSPAESSATSVYSLEWGYTSLSSGSPGNSSSDSIPVDGSPLPSDPPMTAHSSSGTQTTLTKSTISASPWGPDDAAGGQPPTVVPTSAPRKWTPGVSSDDDAGFLLLRLSVVSWEDLLDPRVAERLMQQLRCELNTHMPLTQVSLLRVTRS